MTVTNYWTLGILFAVGGNHNRRSRQFDFGRAELTKPRTFAFSAKHFVVVMEMLLHSAAAIASMCHGTRVYTNAGSRRDDPEHRQQMFRATAE